MRSTILIAATATLALTACQQKTGSSTITTNAETGEVTTTGDAPPSAAAMGLKPGKWEVKVAVSELKMPHMPAGAPTQTPPPMTTSICLTPEQAAKGPADLLKQAKADCTVTSSSYSGGTMKSDMTCKMAGSTMHVVSTGSYTPTTLTTDATMEMTGQMAMSQKTHTEARRVGECTAGK